VPRALAILIAAAAVIAGGRTVPAIELPVVESRLSNGLHLLVHEDHSAPVAALYLFYRSGSGNEQVGRTGIAHLFEHMMFNGGKKYAPGQFDELIEGNGGSTNGYTSRDFTVYLEEFPREALDLILDLEADRMGNLAITAANLEQERGIVKEERRLRVDNDVTGALYEQLYLTALVASPYRWNTVGFMADIDAITLADAQAYFARYYAPNNATLVLSGDLDPEAAHRAVVRAFGRIRAGEPPRPVLNVEPPQRGARRAIVRMEAELPAVLRGYHSVAATDPERPAFDVLDALLSTGNSSRLHRRLVYEAEVAASVGTGLDWYRYPGLLSVYAQARPGHDSGDLEREIDAVVAAIGREPPGEAELRKAKNLLLADYVKGMKTVGGKANRLGFYATVFGDYRALFDVDRQWEAVSADDVARVARAYLTAENSTTIVLVPETRR
jgi:predicted Zn-dependent peptidase